MSLLSIIFLIAFGALIAWELASRAWKSLKRIARGEPARTTEFEGHYAPELERRRRLDITAKRLPRAASWD